MAHLGGTLHRRSQLSAFSPSSSPPKATAVSIQHASSNLVQSRDDEEFEFNPTSIVITDGGNVIRAANRSALDLFGYSPEELFDRPIEMLIAERIRRHHTGNSDDSRHFTSKSTESGSTHLMGVRKDGKIIPVELTKISVDSASGPILLNFIRDLSSPPPAVEEPPPSGEQARSVVANVRDYAIYLLDSNGYVKTWNPGAERIKGYAEEEAIGLHFSRFFIEEDIVQNKPSELLHLASVQGRVEDEGWRVRKDGTVFWADSILTAIYGLGGEIVGFAKVTRDITSKKLAKEALVDEFSEEIEAKAKALRASEELYRNVFDSSPEAVIISRISDETIMDVNRAFLVITGYEREEVIGRTSSQLRLWAHKRDRVKFFEMLRRSLNCSDLDYQFKRKDEDVFWARLSVSLIEFQGSPCALSFARDVSEAKRAEERINNLACYDSLTGLANRRMLFERLTLSLAATGRGSRYGALLFIDLDDFKTLNDTLGHSIGDLMLQEVAHRILRCVRSSDTVGRLGGDEFVIMLEDLSEVFEDAAAEAKRVAAEILAAIARPYTLAGHDCRSESSIGITVFVDPEKTLKELLQEADLAMYQAKAAGRNTMHFFVPELREAAYVRATTEDCLRRAIMLDQFVLHYQPQVNNNRLIGAEALVRWNRPGIGIVPPSEFIPLAERSGLILPLGEWVLNSACRQIAAWSRMSGMASLTVSINISVRQMRHPEFVEQVLSALEQTGANPRNLRFELTESMFVDNFEDVISKMTMLEANGLRFSVDDFGTGFSSLSYLKRLPIDEVKIERSFVRDIVTDGNSGAIAESIILLSRALGLSVIAEGVETEEQRDYLAKLGCTSYQGWLFSRALPTEEFQSMCQLYGGGPLFQQQELRLDAYPKRMPRSCA